MRKSFVLVLLLAGRAWGDPCDAASAKKTRSDADKLVKARQAAKAVTALEELRTACFAKLDPAGQLWLLSELAFAAHAAGDDEKCAKVLDSADDTAITANPKAGKALLYNAGLCAPKEGGCDYKLDNDQTFCRIELAMAYGERNAVTGFEKKPCPLPGASARAVAFGAGCLDRTELRRKGEDDIVCPVWTLLDGGKKRKLKLGGWLDDPSSCCAVQEVSVKGAQLLVASGGPYRDCFGGTATTDYFTTFELKGAELVPVKDFSISWH
jgi:hypothetical protein